MKFTAGPWNAEIGPVSFTCYEGNEHREDGGGFEIRSSAQEPIAQGIWVDTNKAEKIANANLIAAAPEMYAKLGKIATWLEMLAARSEESLKTCRFESLNEAYRADAKNYRSTAADIRNVLRKADGQ